MIFISPNTYWTTSNVIALTTGNVGYHIIIIQGGDINKSFMSSSYGNQYNRENAVRPVVILDSNINIDYINGVWTISPVE